MTANDDESSRKEKLSPRDFMRARRPERFSDSYVVETNGVDRQMLEYHLSTLTSRSQELDFEIFARELAEHTICPNLIPHTGPTGGGDSKVDSETYPVSDSLAFSWFTGIGIEAAKERWAFAFSAKKEWRSKVRSDIAKIKAAKRGYRKAFFVSSQFISDKVRSGIEDELSNKYKLDVRLLDRSWILDQVFKRRLQDLAVETLKMSPTLKSNVQTGPGDFKRDRDLSDVEKRISEATVAQCFGLSFVSDCIQAAELSRELEKPRPETDGRFLRAKHAATSYGTVHQRLMVVYQWAWTAYWWYEDAGRFCELYKEVEKYAVGSINSYDLQLLLNLWTLVFATFIRDEKKVAGLIPKERTDVLSAELNRLCKEMSRPSAALQARSYMFHMTLLEGLLTGHPELVDRALKGYSEVISECGGLLGFAFEPLVNMLSELGELLETNPSYEALFEKIIELSSTRDGNAATAHLLFTRGANQLRQNMSYEAIKTFGKCFHYLCTHESRNNLTRALFLCGCAYERVGLLWAAHGSFVNAASLATSEYWTYSEITVEQAVCFIKIKWIELRLGRLPHVLAWHELDVRVKGILIDQGYDKIELCEDEVEFDAIVGLLCLRAGIEQCGRMSLLPDQLYGLGLHASRLAVLFVLGHEDVVVEELRAHGVNTSDELHKYFDMWLRQPAGDEISDQPYLYEGRRCALESQLLGCSIRMDAVNSPTCVLLAESILAALESFCATCITDGLAASEPLFVITIRPVEFQAQPICFVKSYNDGTPAIDIKCAIASPCGMSTDEQEAVKRETLNIIAHIFATVVVGRALKEQISRLLTEDVADRAINFTSSLVTLTNVLGKAPKTSIDLWEDVKFKSYPLKRWRVWLESESIVSKPKKMTMKMGEGKPPAELLDVATLRHTDLKTVSVIRLSLWEQARWSATAYVGIGDDSIPSIMALVFTNAEAASMIFRKWKKEFGDVDKNETLRVSIIRHIRKANPYSYRVVIGVNPETVFGGSGLKRAVMVSQINMMEPASDANLDRFIQSYNRHKKYYLGYAVMRNDGGFPNIDFKSFLGKQIIYIREAWEIGVNDCDGVAMSRNDDPIIPDGQTDAPVIELLRELRSQPCE